MRLYEQLWDSIGDLLSVADYGALHFLIDHHMIAPLERGLIACVEAIKATEPGNDGHLIERRAALLYRHALRFDAPDDERRRLLVEGLLAIPTGLKTEVHRFPKRVGGGELTTIRQGRRIVWRGFNQDEGRRAARKATSKLAAKA